MPVPIATSDVARETRPIAIRDRTPRSWWVVLLLAVPVSIYALAYVGVGEPMFPPELAASFSARPWGIYPHAFFGAIAVLGGPFQFRNDVLRRRRTLHRRLGTLYVVCCLVVGSVGLLWLESPVVRARPSTRADQRVDALAHFFPNLPHLFERAVLGIAKRPIIAFEARYDRALVPASHCDEQRGAAGQLVGQALRPVRADVDAGFVHRVNHNGMDAIAWLRPRRHGAGFGRVGEVVEEPGGHLRSPGVVDAGEHDGLRHAQQSGPQQLLASGFRARMKALANRPSTCGAM